LLLFGCLLLRSLLGCSFACLLFLCEFSLLFLCEFSLLLCTLLIRFFALFLRIFLCQFSLLLRTHFLLFIRLVFTLGDSLSLRLRQHLMMVGNQGLPRNCAHPSATVHRPYSPLSPLAQGWNLCTDTIGLLTTFALGAVAAGLQQLRTLLAHFVARR